MTTTNPTYPGGSSPFDTIADIYDSELDASPIMTDLRRVVWRAVEQYVPAGGAILELNCGTGTDAIEFAHRGYRMTATDLGSEMLNQARKKSERLGLTNPVAWQQLDVATATPTTFPPCSFDAIFSNFGGLNCLSSSQLQLGLGGLGASLKPGGTVILSIMGKYCIWEFLAFLLRGNLSGALRRTRGRAIAAQLGPAEFDVWYFSPTEINTMVAPWATQVDLLGLSVVSPPPDSRSFINSAPRFTRALMKIDDATRRIFPFSYLGDHFIFIARKRP